MPHVDWTIHVGDVVNTVLTIIMTGIGYGLRQLWKAIRAYFEHVQDMDLRLETTAQVLDLHSDVMEKNGWLSLVPRVSKKRRREDHTVLGL